MTTISDCSRAEVHSVKWLAPAGRYSRFFCCEGSFFFRSWMRIAWQGTIIVLDRSVAVAGGKANGLPSPDDIVDLDDSPVGSDTRASPDLAKSPISVDSPGGLCCRPLPSIAMWLPFNAVDRLASCLMFSMYYVIWKEQHLWWTYGISHAH